MRNRGARSARRPRVLPSACPQDNGQRLRLGGIPKNQLQPCPPGSVSHAGDELGVALEGDRSAVVRNCDTDSDLAVLAAEQKISFPMTSHSPILDCRGPLADRDGIYDPTVDVGLLGV